MSDNKSKLNFEIDGAVFSSDRKMRYLLWRKLSEGKKKLLVIGLNPSTATETENDATIRRCIGFSREWGYGSLVVANLFAYRATKPADMRKAIDPIGRDNDSWLIWASQYADLTLAAWGNDGLWRNRHRDVHPLLVSPQCLGITTRGAPRHPLYVLGATKPVPFEGGL